MRSLDQVEPVLPTPGAIPVPAKAAEADSPASVVVDPLIDNGSIDIDMHASIPVLMPVEDVEMADAAVPQPTELAIPVFPAPVILETPVAPITPPSVAVLPEPAPVASLSPQLDLRAEEVVPTRRESLNVKVEEALASLGITDTPSTVSSSRSPASKSTSPTISLDHSVYSVPPSFPSASVVGEAPRVPVRTPDVQRSHSVSRRHVNDDAGQTHRLPALKHLDANPESERKSFDVRKISQTRKNDSTPTRGFTWFRKREDSSLEDRAKAFIDQDPAGANANSAAPVETLGRPSISASIVASEFYNSSEYHYDNGQKLRIRYHRGPIDQRAMTSKHPVQLLVEVTRVLEDLGMEVAPSEGEAKIRVTRFANPRAAVAPVPAVPPKMSVEASRTSQSGLTREKIIASGRTGKMAAVLASLPMSLVKRIKYMAQHGSNWNKGYDGKSRPSISEEAFVQISPGPGAPDLIDPPLELLEDIRFHVEIQKIKNLDGLYVVEFKRMKGDIWAFKKLYQDLIPKIPFKSPGEFSI
ncbi:uncharacterized protein BJ171DRAFT_29245 [Polychytrium aggregatum]|uniref:uncharacterized protein n=1 Tax=Polychytrium aggregatum TaxID=110093 RepID=UPI0022FEB0A3|nr:uncharacterized protein BJ171DRAFT_29245 [Polychytrium aggregatum]KAI9206378.1 hypothetical protein BJ171DRAFT_29245 [Polychytrium aggregatum]